MPGFFGNLKERVGTGGIRGALRVFRRGGDGEQDDAQSAADLESGEQARPQASLAASMTNTLSSGLTRKISLMVENRFGVGARMNQRALRGWNKNQELRRHQALKLLKDPAEVRSLQKLRAKIKMTRQKSSDSSGHVWADATKDKETDQDNPHEEQDDVEEELLDVIQELGLSVEPSVEELGDPTIIEQRRNGTFNARDEQTVLAFRRHKAKKGRVIFEAENANNIACEIYMAGDVETANLYFRRALELTSQDRKPAQEELDELHQFIAEWYNCDEGEFYAALSEGEWRMALGRRRFVQVMKKLEYPGNADRLFGMLDSLSPDGKISLPEIQMLTKLKPHRLLNMDRDIFEKGVVLSNLACCHLQRGEATAGLQRLREAMTITTGNGFGVDHSTVQKIMGNIAVAYIKLGDLDAALDYLAQLVEVRERTAGRLSEGVLTALFHVGFCFLMKANTFNILGDCQRPDGRIQEKPVEVNYSLALCAFKERLRRQEEIFEDADQVRTQDAADEMRLEIARTQEIIAEIHEKCGEPHRSLDFLARAVAHKEEILSDSDPELLSTWNIYAGICFKAGKFPEALDAMSKATNTSAALFGEASVTVAKELYHSGLILFKMGAQQFRTEEREASLGTYAEALEKLRQSLPIQEDLLGEDAADVADNIHLQGSIHLARNELVDARKHFEQALLCRLRCFGRTHIKVASSCHALGCLFSRIPRRREEAIQLLRKAVLIREKRLGHESLYLAESLHELGSALMQRAHGQDSEVALQHLSKAASIRDNRVGKKSLLYAASMHQVGQAHLHLNYPMEAKLYFQAAVTLRQELLGKRCAQTAASKFGMALALFNLGDLKGAMKNFKASYTARESLFGMEHALSADSLHQIGQVYVKKKELEASLPFFLAALEIRKTLNRKDVEQLDQDSDEEDKYVFKPESERQRRIRHKKEKARLEKIKRKKEEAKEEARRKVREEKEMAKAKEEQRKREMAQARSTGAASVTGSLSAGGSHAYGMKLFAGFGAKIGKLRSAKLSEARDDDMDMGGEHGDGGGRKSRRSSKRNSLKSDAGEGRASEARKSKRNSRRSSSAAELEDASPHEGKRQQKDSTLSGSPKFSVTSRSSDLRKGGSMADSGFFPMEGSGMSMNESGFVAMDSMAARSSAVMASSESVFEMTDSSIFGHTVSHFDSDITGSAPMLPSVDENSDSVSMSDKASNSSKPSIAGRRKLMSKKSSAGEGEGSEEENGSEVESLFGEGGEIQAQSHTLRPAFTSSSSLVRDEDADSEVDISEIGIDVRGCLAPVLAHDFHIISKVFLDLKDFEKAKEYLDQSICLREEVFGSSSSEYADALHAFGALYCKKREAQHSLKYFLKALAVREKVCGHLHPDTAQTEIELGEALAEVGQPDEASIHLLRGCNIRESIFGTDDIVSKRLREKWSGLSAGATFYDPVTEGEALPHFARRSPESFLHGFAAAHMSQLQRKAKAVSEDEGVDNEEYQDDEEKEDNDDEEDSDEDEDDGSGDNEEGAE